MIVIATKTRTTEKAKPSGTRDRLLDAAQQVFARRGLHAASVGEIAREAGLTTGAVYSNFLGKEDLFLALLERQTTARIEEIRSLLEGDEPAEERIQHAGRVFRDVLHSQPDWPLLFYEFWAQAARDPELRPEFVKHRRALRRALGDTLEQLADAFGLELPLPAEHLALAINALANGLASERLVDERGVPEDLFERVLGLMLQTLRAGAAATAERQGSA